MSLNLKNLSDRGGGIKGKKGLFDNGLRPLHLPPENRQPGRPAAC